LHAGLSFLRLIDRFRLRAAPSLVSSVRDRSSVRTEVARRLRSAVPQPPGSVGLSIST